MKQGRLSCQNTVIFLTPHRVSASMRVDVAKLWDVIGERAVLPEIRAGLHETIHDDDGLRAARDPTKVVRPGEPQEYDKRKNDDDDSFHVHQDGQRSAHRWRPTGGDRITNTRR